MESGPFRSPQEELITWESLLYLLPMWDQEENSAGGDGYLAEFYDTLVKDMNDVDSCSS